MRRSLFSLTLLAVSLAGCMQQYSLPHATKPLPTPAPIMAGAAGIQPIGTIPSNAVPVKVGLLVPLSGESVTIGNAMLDAATMALYDSYLPVPADQIHSQIVLIPKDSGNTPADAARATKEVLAEGATFIIGPLFSQSVTTAVAVARESHVNMLTFSNNKSVAGNGVYVFGFLPEQQVARMADYAFLHNLTRVALLAPNDTYGQKIQEALVGSYTQKGGTVAPSELYAPSPANIDAAVARLAAYNNANPDRRFQAIFVADGGYQLKNIIASFKKTNIDLTKIKLLGTGLWDDPEITKIPEMNGALFSSSTPMLSQAFEKRFITTYGYKPIRLASLAYDAVTIAAQLTINNTGPNFGQTALTIPTGFPGLANGLVRLRADGTSDRKLAILQITPGGFQVIDAAPNAYDDSTDNASVSAEAPPSAH